MATTNQLPAFNPSLALAVVIEAQSQYQRFERRLVDVEQGLQDSSSMRDMSYERTITEVNKLFTDRVCASFTRVKEAQEGWTEATDTLQQRLHEEVQQLDANIKALESRVTKLPFSLSMWNDVKLLTLMTLDRSSNIQLVDLRKRVITLIQQHPPISLLRPLLVRQQQLEEKLLQQGGSIKVEQSSSPAKSAVPTAPAQVTPLPKQSSSAVTTKSAAPVMATPLEVLVEKVGKITDKNKDKRLAALHKAFESVRREIKIQVYTTIGEQAGKSGEAAVNHGREHFADDVSLVVAILISLSNS